MKLVVDANVIIASFIRKGKAAELLINPLLELYAPDFIIEEVHKYKEEIISRTHRNLESLSIILSDMLSIISIIPEKETSDYLKEAEDFSPDEKDVPYLALALKLNCPILSNDKDLKERQDKVKVYTMDEMISLLKEKK